MMNKIILLTIMMVIMIPLVSLAANGEVGNTALGSGIGKIGVGIGAGLVVIGAGIGFSNIGGKAMEGIARQPEAASEIRSNMIIIAALLEGVAFFGLVICLLILFL